MWQVCDTEHGMYFKSQITAWKVLETVVKGPAMGDLIVHIPFWWW